MINLNKNQIQLISELLIDNSLIYEEANNTVLVIDHNFCSRINSIQDYCYNLYLDTLNGKTNTEIILTHLSSLLNKIAEYRNSYEDSIVGTVGSRMYMVMNSFFDKTNETFYEFIKQL